MLSLNKNPKEEYFYEEASSLARLGSGSASRSIYGGFNVWGKTEIIEHSCDKYTIPVPIQPASVFQGLQDSILIVASGKKKVSSSAGHQLMENHPYKKNRIEQAKRNTKKLINALSNSDWESFANICEEEAMSLHALMLSSRPSFILMEQNTLEIIRRIHIFREENKLPLCFTLDAGPNIHLIYPGENKSEIQDFIKAELLQFCENNNWIDDKLGTGPELIYLNNE